MSTASGSAWPPAASIAAAALWIVPGNLGCGVSVLAAITILAPSRAARSAIAKPMPRLAPEIKMVLPANVDMPDHYIRIARLSALRYCGLLAKIGLSPDFRTLSTASQHRNVLYHGKQRLRIPDLYYELVSRCQHANTLRINIG